MCNILKSLTIISNHSVIILEAFAPLDVFLFWSKCIPEHAVKPPGLATDLVLLNFFRVSRSLANEAVEHILTALSLSLLLLVSGTGIKLQRRICLFPLPHPPGLCCLGNVIGFLELLWLMMTWGHLCLQCHSVIFVWQTGQGTSETPVLCALSQGLKVAILNQHGLEFFSTVGCNVIWMLTLNWMGLSLN